MEWLKWFVGATTDPKFAVIARRSKQNMASVIAVWAMLLERAGQADERGEVEGFDCEGADIVLGAFEFISFHTFTLRELGQLSISQTLC